jgi:hypothetical protein
LHRGKTGRTRQLRHMRLSMPNDVFPLCNSPFLPARRQAHPLIEAVTLASVTACLFGLLAWRVGVRPELLAYSALAAVGVPLAVIDVLEQRLSTKLLMPATPSSRHSSPSRRSQNTTVRRSSVHWPE